MYDIIRTLRFSAIIAFILYLVYLFARFLFLPILIFVLIMKLFSYIKINKKQNKKSDSKMEKDNILIALRKKYLCDLE